MTVLNFSTKPNVYVIDDDEAVRDSLRMLLRTEDLSVVIYTSADAFLQDYNERMRGCLVLDIRMPGMNGLELQAALNERGALLPIIFITGHGDVPMAVTAMQRGAEEFLQKPFDETELIQRVHQALQKEQQWRKNLLDRESVRERLATLTARERDVMHGIIAGKANKVIAAESACSPRTVEIHRARVMEKLGVRSVAELVRIAMQAEE